MGKLQDINCRKSDPTMCMVVGCSGKALYRSAYAGSKGRRGYCVAHKDKALMTDYSNDFCADYMADRYGD